MSLVPLNPADAPSPLTAAAPIAPPPPSEALLAAVGAMGPVGTRVPLRALGWVLGAGAISTAMMVSRFPLRADLPWLPRGPWLAMGLVWMAGAALALGAAMLPSRGAVLPDGARALRAVLALAGLAALLLLVFPVEAPGHTDHSAEAARAHGAACFLIATMVAALPAAAALFALRRLLTPGGWAIGAAVGGGAGALGALALHLICGVGGPWHLGLAHGGALLLCAALGAIGGGVLSTRSGR